MRRAIVIVLSVVLALIVTAPMATAQKAPEDKKIGTYTDDWWNWALQNPRDSSPLWGDNYEYHAEKCDGNNQTDAWFLAGQFALDVDSDTGDVTFQANRKCTAPAGKALFFPVLNFACSPLFGDDPRNPDNPWTGGFPGCAKYYTDQATPIPGYEPKATVNGKAVPVQRAASGNFSITFDDSNNFLGADPGTYPAATDGHWVLTPPLQKSAKPQTVHWEGQFKNPFAPEAEDPRLIVNITYELTVE